MSNGGGGGGGSYATVRTLPVDDDIEIISCDVQVNLEPTGIAKFSYRYEIFGIPKCTPHDYFFFFVPSAFANISELRAFDDQGTLRTDQEEYQPSPTPKTKMKIHYREKMVEGKKQVIQFSFKVQANTIPADQILAKLIFYTDYMAFTVPCRLLVYQIVPPTGYKFYKSRKEQLTLAHDVGPEGAGPIKFRFENLSPLSAAPVQCAVRKTHTLTKRAWLAIVGALVTCFLGVAMQKAWDAAEAAGKREPGSAQSNGAVP